MIQLLLAASMALSMLNTSTSAEAKDKPLPRCDQNTIVATPEQKQSRGCQIQVKHLHPTQPAVGLLAVRCKAQKITAKYNDGKLSKYLGDPDRFVPLVRGPGGVFYLTDHHHLAAGLWNADVPSDMKIINAYLIADLSSLTPGGFWAAMQANNFTWLKDVNDRQISPDQLPKSVSLLVDDPRRTLSAWVREGCGYIKCDSTNAQSCSTKFPQTQCAKAFFLEFAWATYLGNVPAVANRLNQTIACPQQDVMNSTCLTNQRKQLTDVLPAAMTAAAAPEARSVGGTNGGYNPQVQIAQPEPENCGNAEVSTRSF